MKTQWFTKKGTGADVKIGNRVTVPKLFKPNQKGTVTAVEKGFQRNIDTGCPYYYVQVKFDNDPVTYPIITKYIVHIE